MALGVMCWVLGKSEFWWRVVDDESLMVVGNSTVLVEAQIVEA